MSNKKSVAEATSADDKSIGFEYQYYFFLDKLLNLKSGQSVGLEVEDDVHVEFDADFIFLFQLKHTVKKSLSGVAISLTELDDDFWKTIYNWSCIITDAAQNRSTINSQIAFVRKAEFHLVTNKSQSKRNDFLILLEKYKVGRVDFGEIKSSVLALHQKTTDLGVKKHIAKLLALDDSVAEQFLRRVYVTLSLDDVIGRVKTSIRDKFVDPEKIDAVYQRLDSTIRSDNFISIKAGEPVLISYEEFMKRYRNIFIDARSKSLSSPSFTPTFPNDIFAQAFIKRLIEIEALQPEDTETAIDYTTQKLRIARYLESWVQSGDLISDEVNALHAEVYLRWKNRFAFAFRKCTSSKEVIDSAIELLVALRNEKFQVGPSELDTHLSNGELYYLSDDGRIGWHRDWEKM